MIVFKRGSRQGYEVNPVVLKDAFEDFQGMSTSEFLEPMNLCDDSRNELSSYLLPYEMLYKPEDGEKIILKNVCLTQEEGKKPGNMITIKMINDEPHICFVHPIKDNYYKATVICKESDLLTRHDVIKLYKQYEQYIDDWKHLVLEGEQKIDKNVVADFRMSSYNQFEVALNHLEYKYEIGRRTINMSPFESYIKLGIPTVNGSSRMLYPFIGEGYGRKLYDIVDNVLPYQQIPHGYAGAPYDLSKDSTRFWEKRNQHRVTPTIRDDIAAQMDYIDSINDIMCNQHIVNISENDVDLYFGYYLSTLPDINIQKISDDIFLINSNHVRLITAPRDDMIEDVFIPPSEFREMCKKTLLDNGMDLENTAIKNVIRQRYPDIQFPDMPLPYSR